MSLLQVNNLSVAFPVFSGIFKRITGYFSAVKDVSFALEEGEVLSVIGESGSGKTTIGNTILGLVHPSEGDIHYRGEQLSARQFSGKIQAVFQNPYSSLNPRMNVLSIVSEPLRRLEPSLSRDEVTERVKNMLEVVGIDPDVILRYPHQFSGGQRQRLSIARALISSPELLILDEPVSSLDVSIRAQILNLLAHLKKERGLSYIYISHDLATVRFLSRNVLIIYNGRVLEKGRVEAIFQRPSNPYTELLLRSARDIIVASPKTIVAESAEGCPFHPRCPRATPECKQVFPKMTQIEEGHDVFCHHPL